MATTRKTYPKEGLAKLSEAAVFLNCAGSTLRGWCREDRIDHVEVGTHYRIPWDVLHDYAAGRYRLRRPKKELA